MKNVPCGTNTFSNLNFYLFILLGKFFLYIVSKYKKSGWWSCSLDDIHNVLYWLGLILDTIFYTNYFVSFINHRMLPCEITKISILYSSIMTNQIVINEIVLRGTCFYCIMKSIFCGSFFLLSLHRHISFCV